MTIKLYSRNFFIQTVSERMRDAGGQDTKKKKEMFFTQKNQTYIFLSMF